MVEGVGELYLSDVLNTSHFEKGYFNVIEAPCGSGKTEAAINKIAPLASKLDKAIYLIDTKLGKDRLSLDSRLTTPYVGYADDVDYAHLFGLETDGKLCVTTYAQFGFWCYRFGRDFTDHYEYIICDEPQNLINFSEIGKKKPTDIPTHRIAREAIDRACWMGDSYVVGITATPEPLNKLGALKTLFPLIKQTFITTQRRKLSLTRVLIPCLRTLNSDKEVGFIYSMFSHLSGQERLLRREGLIRLCFGVQSMRKPH